MQLAQAGQAASLYGRSDMPAVIGAQAAMAQSWLGGSKSGVVGRLLQS